MKKISLFILLMLYFAVFFTQAQNKVASFDGTESAEITFDVGVSDEPLTTFTVELLIYPHQKAEYQTVMMSTANNNIGWGVFRMQFQTDLTLEVGVDIRNAPNDIIQSAETVELDVWQHYAYVFDNGNHVLYKNGGEIANVPSSANSITSVMWDIPWKLGHGYRSFLGEMDDVWIWTVARTADEIKNNALAPFDTVAGQDGLYAYYLFDLDNAADSTGSGVDGTLGAGVTIVEMDIDIPPELIPTSINDNLITENNLSIYPNPATDRLVVNTGDIKGSVEIINTNGLTIMQSNIRGGDVKFDTGGIAPGVYLIRVRTTNGVIVSKFFKK